MRQSWITWGAISKCDPYTEREAELDTREDDDVSRSWCEDGRHGAIVEGHRWRP